MESRFDNDDEHMKNVRETAQKRVKEEKRLKNDLIREEKLLAEDDSREGKLKRRIQELEIMLKSKDDANKHYVIQLRKQEKQIESLHDDYDECFKLYIGMKQTQKL